MDGGQFRVLPRANRGTVSRPEPVRRPMEKPHPQVEKKPAEPASVHAAASPRQTKSQHGGAPSRPKHPIRLIVACFTVAVILVAGGLLAWPMLQGPNTPGIDSSKYQAVFLVNGDIYFGKLESADRNYLKLTNIYYIQSPTSKSADDQTEQTADDQNNVQLIKLGEEIYGPEDLMMISRDQVMLYENLKPDSKVAQAIDKYKQ